MQFYMPTLIILNKQHFCFSVHFFKQAPLRESCDLPGTIGGNEARNCINRIKNVHIFSSTKYEINWEPL